MLQVVTVETYLDASPGLVWDAVNDPRALCYAAHPMMRFTPIRPERFPARWEDGEYLVRMHWRGLIPIGRQRIRISHPAPVDGRLFMLDDGDGGLCRRWRHLVSVEPEGQGTRYRDEVGVEAGMLTPFIASFARRFYRHRQTRWRALVRSDFNLQAIPDPRRGA